MTADETVLTILVRATAALLGGGILGAVIGRCDPRIRHRLWAATLGGALAAGVGGWLAAVAGWQWNGGAILTPLSFRSDQQVTLILLVAWAAGTAVVAGRALRGLAAAGRLAMRSQPLMDSRWQASLAEAAGAVGAVTLPRLLVSPTTSVPLTLGIRRPAIVLPMACEAWTTERLRAVLVHEMSHVERRDCAMELFVQLVCGVYWFHPAAWWVARRLRLAREQACDAAVLRAGTSAAEYAEHLVALLRSVAGAPAKALGVALGRQTALEARLVALASAACPQGGPLVRQVAAVAPLALAVVVGLWSPVDRATPESSALSAAHTGKARCDCSRKHHRTPN
jgi:beta-lactamase regulating signal transducer with metallopeptidase domain